MLETEERKQISPEGDKNKRAIDMEQFGGFVTEMRKEHGFTQKELAERLFISNKAVSKWERGLSMPDISLLEPLARELGVTVVELLHGGRACEEEGAEELSEKELLEYIEGFQILSAEEKEKLKIRRKKMGLLYFAEIILATSEVLLLYLAGPSLGIMAFDVSIDMLTIEPLIVFFGIWVFFFPAGKAAAHL